MSSAHFVSIRDLLNRVLPVAGLELPAQDVLEQVKISPAAVYPDPLRGIRTETQLIIGHRFETHLPLMDMISLAVGGTQAPIKLNYSIHPEVAVQLGPCPVSFYWDNTLLLPVRKVQDGDRRIAFEPDPDNTRFAFHVDECWLSYAPDRGLGFDSRLVISIPPFMIQGTDLVLGADEAGIVFGESLYSGVLAELGFDESFRGVFANEGVLYWLPEIQLADFDLPGLRIDLSDVAIGNQGVSCNIALAWEVAVNDDGTIDDSGTELLGSFFDDNWQIALASVSGELRRNIPQAMSLKTYLRVPFFGAVFSTYFSLAYRVGADGSAAYRSTLQIVKESTDPIVVSHFDGQLSLRLDQFQAGGFLSDQGFAIEGSTAFGVDLFGFALEVASAQLAYTHLQKSDDFAFTMRDVVLGDLGEVGEAQLIIKTHENEQAERLFDRVEIKASYFWEDLQHLIPQDLQDLVGLPEDGLIQAVISWAERENESGNGAGNEAGAGGARRLRVELKTGVSHLDNLWLALPAAFRPEVRRIESVFRIDYSASDKFVPAEAGTDNGGEYVEREGITVGLTAQIELKLPDLEGLAVPALDFLHIDTGDAEGFITAEFDAQFSASDQSGSALSSALRVANPFAIDLNLPGTQADAPFVHNRMDRIELRFNASDDAGGESGIGGALLCAGAFEFRPLVPLNMPFAAQFNSLLHQVGLDEILGSSTLKLAFDDDGFDLEIAGEFEQFGIELDIFQMLAGLAGSAGGPQSQDIDIDFDIGFRLIGFRFNVGYGEQEAGADRAFYFAFDLKVECSMTGLPPLRAAISLSSDEFSFGLEDLTIPLEVPHYPIDGNDLDRLRGDGGRYTRDARLEYEAEIASDVALIDDQLADPGLPAASRFRLVKDKSHLELKMLMLQLVMAIHQRVADDGKPTYETLIEIDTLVHAAVFNLLHVDTDIQLHFPEIKFRIPFDDPAGIAVEGKASLTGFADDDPMKPLEGFRFGLGLSSQYIFLKIESSGEPLPIPSFGSKYDDGSVSISRFMIGYGYTKNSFALDFAGELILPSALIEDADTSQRIGAGIRLPRYNKLAFKIDLIPVTIGKATVLIPLPQFDLDLRTPTAPALLATDRCTPYWDGLEFIVNDLLHVDHKRLAFSPFFGMGIVPNIRLDADLQLGSKDHGLTVIADDVLILIGVVTGMGSPPMLPIPFFADPTSPYFQNLCVNLRVAGFQLNFNLQRPFPSLSPLAAIEAFGLLSDPLMEIDPKGALANTIRFTLSDGYLQVPDPVLQMFPEAANFVDRRYAFTLNLGTLISMVQALVKGGTPLVEALQAFAKGEITQIQDLLAGLDNPFDPWDWLTLLPPELRKFRTGGQIAGFEASVCLVLATAAEAEAALQHQQAANKPLPPLKLRDSDNPEQQLVTTRRNRNPEFDAISAYRFATSWSLEGEGQLAWQRHEDAVLVNVETVQHGYVVFQRKPLPDEFHLQLGMQSQTLDPGSASGVVLCYAGAADHYCLRTEQRDDACWLVLDKVTTAGSQSLMAKRFSTRLTDGLQLELTSYLHQQRRHFIIDAQTLPVADAGARLRPLRVQARVRDDIDPLAAGDFGLFARGPIVVGYDEALVYRIRKSRQGVRQLSPTVMTSGFNVNLKPDQTAAGRLIDKDETLSLFEGIEFRRFNRSSLAQIPSEQLLHLSDDAERIYLGAYVKVFEGQRIRFLGSLYADGSFALVSEAEIRPLQLRVFNVPVKLPIEVYGSLTLVGRQKRNGYHGMVEARGCVDWTPIPNVLRITAGTPGRPVTLALHSDARFLLRGEGQVSLFNGALAIGAAVEINEQRAAFSGDLSFAVPVHDDVYQKLLQRRAASSRKVPGRPNLIELKIKGEGEVENLASFRFVGKGEVRILGEVFSGVDVMLADHYASFRVYFNKGVNTGGTLIEQAFPIMTRCELGLDARCTVDIRKATRPSFVLEGEGFIRILGAEMRGKGAIVAQSGPGRGAAQDFFEARMEGALLWQGRKWLGGQIVVGSRGLLLSGTTHFGLSLTPNQIAGVNIASLYLDIKLEGEFRLDVDKQSVSFAFKGGWTLGAAMADTGNDGRGHRQILPLAASEFAFNSSAGLVGEEYKLRLFHIDGFKFMPFDQFTIPVPSISVASGAKPAARFGKTNEPDEEGSVPTAEFRIPGADPSGIRFNFPFPQLYGGDDAEDLDWNSNDLGLYAPGDLRLGVQNLTFDATALEDLSIYLSLVPDLDSGFPLRITFE